MALQQIHDQKQVDELMSKELHRKQVAQILYQLGFTHNDIIDEGQLNQEHGTEPELRVWRLLTSYTEMEDVSGMTPYTETGFGSGSPHATIQQRARQMILPSPSVPAKSLFNFLCYLMRFEHLVMGENRSFGGTLHGTISYRASSRQKTANHSQVTELYYF